PARRSARPRARARRAAARTWRRSLPPRRALRPTRGPFRRRRRGRSPCGLSARGPCGADPTAFRLFGMTDTKLWHPFADMAAVRGDEFVLVRGEGVYVWDDAGNRYLDGCASLWYCNVGHGREEIAEAAAKQLRTLE